MADIYQKINAVMGDIGAVEKSRRNEQQKYQFRGIEDFYQAAHPAFVRHGVFCSPEVVEHASSTFEKANFDGKVTVWRHVTVKVRHRFYAGDGSYVDVTTMGEGLDNSDKATNKAMSGAMKYALIELFSVPTQDVEDADRTSPEAGTTKRITEKIPISRNPVMEAAQVNKDASGKGIGTLPEKVADKPLEGPSPAGAQAPPMREPGSDDEDPEEYAKKQPPATFIDEPIGLPKQRALHRAFVDSIPASAAEETKKRGPTIFREWLKHQGYIGEDGQGSTKKIPEFMFDEVRKNAVEFARKLK